MKRVLGQSTDNQWGQDKYHSFYNYAPTQTAFVPIAGSLSVQKPQQEAAIVTGFLKMKQSETHFLYLLFVALCSLF